MTNIKVDTLKTNLFEELSDADSVVVAGGADSVTDTLLNGVASANNGIGNGGTPTTGAVHLAANTLIASGNYLNGVGNGLELGLQAVNGTVTGVAGELYVSLPTQELRINYYSLVNSLKAPSY